MFLPTLLAFFSLNHVDPIQQGQDQIVPSCIDLPDRVKGHRELGTERGVWPVEGVPSGATEWGYPRAWNRQIPTVKLSFRPIMDLDDRTSSICLA